MLKLIQITCQILPCSNLIESPNWSYNIENSKDVIEFSLSNKSMLHNYITYDQKRNICLVSKTGELSDTNKKHLELYF